jgi:phospholipid/cholesterol/gamma-HCH transport system substrate-binding protein
MPSQQEVKWSQLKVGVIVLVSVVVLTTLLFLMTSSSGLGVFTRKLTITTYFENASGLKVGAAVNAEGVTIGTVKSVTITSAPERKATPVVVVMKIDGKYQGSLHKDSTAALTTVGVLGDTVVDINSQFATGPLLQDGDELKTLETPSLFDVVKQSQGAIENVNILISKMNAVVDNLQSGKGSVGRLLTDPQLYNTFTAAADNINKLTLKLNSPDNSIGKLMNDNGQLYNQADDIITKVDAVTSDLQAGKGTAGILLKDPAAANNLNASLASLKSILEDAQAGKGTAGLLLKDPAVAKNLNETISQMNTLLTGINQGQGTLGKLAKDDTTSTNLNNLLTESTKLVSTIRADPKKYLTIHLKIF